MANNLIVGGDGFVSRHLSNQLIADGHEVFSTTRRPGSTGIELDLAGDLNLACLPEVNFRTVFLTAACSNMELCEENKSLSQRINIDAPCRIAEWAERRSTRVCFLSSSQVYNGVFPCPTEEEGLGPQNAYGEQKLAAEKNLIDVTKDLAIIRPSKIVGEMQGVFSTWHKMLGTGNEIKAAENIFVSPVNVKAVVKVMLEIEDMQASGVFNMSAPDQVSYLEAAKILASSLDVKPRLVRGEQVLEENVPAKFRPQNTVLDCSAVEKLSGLKLSSSRNVLQEMIQRW